MKKNIDKQITKEMLEAAMKCTTAEELIELAKTEDVDLTQEEAESYLSELADSELDEKTLEKIAGGGACYAVGGCTGYEL